MPRLGGAGVLGVLSLLVQSPLAEGAGADDEMVSVLVAGLRGYEASFEAVSWTQEWFWPPNEARRGCKRNTWLAGERSRRYRDTDWRWFHESYFCRTHPPDDCECVTRKRALYFGNAGSRVAGGEESAWKGVIAAQDGFFIGAATLESLLGRGVDYGATHASRGLSTIIEQAQDRKYLPPTPEEPWPGVRAVRAVGLGWSNVDVRVDPEADFLPRLIRVWRPGDGAIAETVVTVESQVIEGVHVPVVGIRAPMYNDMFDTIDLDRLVPEEIRRDFALALRLDGLPPLSEETRSSLIRWIPVGHRVRVIDPECRLIEGPLAWGDEKREILSPMVVLVSDVRLNERMTLQQMIAEFPPSANVLSAYTWRRAPLEQEARIWEQWGPRVVHDNQEGVP